MTGERCIGYPDGSECVNRVKPGWLYCDPCRLQRQKDGAASLIGDWVAVGDLIEGVNVPTPVCDCGGDRFSPKHEQSLLHRRYVWAQEQSGPLTAPPQTLAELRRTG